ncbi:MAG: VWA containing CoxE family protein [Clostridiales bacterium]|nr:VWA containing CoxE family protein [Clostridiales bacterium]
MFIPFFYLMRARGLKPSIIQWMTLMEALNQDFADSSLTGFYHLCRCVLISSEADFDKFDEVFLEFFHNVGDRQKMPEEMSTDLLPEGMLDWLSAPSDPAFLELYYSEEHMAIMQGLMEVMERMLRKLEEDLAKGNFIGGCEVCNGCGLCMRMYMKDGEIPEDAMMQDGPLPIQKGWKRPRDAMSLAQDRVFRDFRDDTVLDIRQFQMAFRKLRQYSTLNDVNIRELDIDQTIKKTSEKAGLLHIVYKRPRKNIIKLIVLIDSDGSMSQFAEVTNKLFQAVSKANHYKDLEFYYYHNCIYDHLYTDPTCVNSKWVETEHVLRNHDTEYRVIVVGDASMADSELFRVGGNVLFERSNALPGIEWLKRLKRRYRRSVWLNPIPKEDWERLYGGNTIQAVKEVYPMFELTVKGLGNAIKRLLSEK